MFGILFRVFWRVLVFVTAILLAYGTAFVAFPYLDKRIPAFPALLIIYFLIAYVVIPLLVRFWRVVIQPDHIPHYVITADGWPSDPVNIAIAARSKRQLVKTMRRAGWHVADRITLWTSLKLGYAMILNKPYPTAPFSSLYLFGRRQDIGFQIQDGDPPTPRHRHHVRFWQVANTTQVSHSHRKNYTFWSDLLARFLGKKKAVWLGAATHDIGPFAIRWRNGQITHLIDEDTEREQNFIIKSLKDIKAVRSLTEVKAGEPLRFRGQTIGVDLIADGCLPVIELRHSLITKTK